MRSFSPRRTGTSLLALAMLAGCAAPSLSPDDRAKMCRIAVETKFDRPTFKPNVLSNAAGGAVGAAGGALGGLQGGMLAIFTVPLFAAIGAGAGTACAIAAIQHPSADADFERWLNAAGSGALTRTLQTELDRPRAECRSPAPPDARPDAVIEIQKIEAGMSCLLGKQRYWIAVDWRAVSTRTGNVLTWASTRCAQASDRSVDAWFADPEFAKAEIERVLAGTGQRIAMEFFAQERLTACAFESKDDSGSSPR
jgi:hypothetical protein